MDKRLKKVKQVLTRLPFYSRLASSSTSSLFSLRMFCTRLGYLSRIRLKVKKNLFFPSSQLFLWIHTQTRTLPMRLLH